ncbi:MAG: hypothetical protein JWM21_1562 [Acidobacteria bacterium]|nr:hypothetical protein [Acidobacteriota bacterium]
MSATNLFDAIFLPERASLPAVLSRQRELTYGELRAETIRAAVALKALRIENGERVAILLNDSSEFIAAFLAIQLLGGIAVPINMALSVADQRLILNDSTARAAVVEGSLCNTLLTAARNRLRHLHDLLLVSRAEEMELHHVEGINSRRFDEPSAERAVPDMPESSGNIPAFILYTSGSTGEPKGAIHTESDVFYTNDTFCKQVLDLRPGDRLFSSSRLPFAYGLGNSFSFPLLNGMTTVLSLEKPTPEVIGQTFREYKPTVFFGVPVVYNLLLEHHRKVQALDCSALRLCISAGEALPAHLGEAWQNTFGVQVLDGIGSTEMLHMWMSNHQGAVRYGSSGQLLQGYEAQLLDQQGQPTPAGQAGNLWVKGASAAKGYWQRPEITASTFVDGWVRTGDLYSRDPDGFWFHMGRSDDCFKSSGQWVSPVEVEGVLARHSSVRTVAVVESLDEAGLPSPSAFIVVNIVSGEIDQEQLEDELRQMAKAALPRFKRPRKYLFVLELPYTATGKVQRFKLREQLRKKD